MGGKSDAMELDSLVYALQGTAPSWAAVSEVFAALHTADPTDAGNQSSSECDYTGYTRVTISRSSSHWTYSSTTLMSNVGAVSFPACTGGSNVATHVSIGLSFSGAGAMMYSGALTASLTISSGITPSFNTQSLTISED